MQNEKIVNTLGILLFISLAVGFLISEDTLGAAKHDYIHHEKFIVLFAENFFSTFQSYGNGDLHTRNSPVFYIFLSLLYKSGITLELIRYLNFISLFFISYFFYECLKVKFKDANRNTLKIFILLLFLSPTIRSLIIWPYPMLYALIFFLITVKYYLLFNNSKKNKLRYSLLCTFFLSVASYITPNFSVFVIFFLYKFFLEFKLSKSFIYILLLNLALSIPAFLYYYTFDFYFMKYSVTGVDKSLQFNFFNKIVLIISLIGFYILPFLSKNFLKRIFDEIKNFKDNKIIITFCILSILLFNFPDGFGFGGGIFFHLSHKLFSNNLLLFLIFFIFVYFFKASNLININNIIIFLCLNLYNAQTSVYHKYFDPLLIFIFLFLMSFKNSKIKIDLSSISEKYLALYTFFLCISFFKVYLN